MDKLKKIFSNPIFKFVIKIISWVILSFFIILAGILIYYVISSKIYEIRGQKYEPSLSLYTIISPSMEPNINVYDVVITKKVDPKEIKEGDIITFISTSTLGEGLTITHRVKSVIATANDVKFRTQGDNNPIPDSSLVSTDKLIGKVIFKIPFLGRIQFLLQSKSGWVFILLVPAIIIVAYDVIKVLRLTDVKKKVAKSLEKEEEDSDLVMKKAVLKQNLKKKFVNVKQVDPIMTLEDDSKKGIKTAKVKNSYEKKVEGIEEVPVKKKYNKEKLIKEVKKISKEEESFDADKIINNINNVEDDEDIKLPKTKK